MTRISLVLTLILQTAAVLVAVLTAKIFVRKNNQYKGTQ